MKYLKQMNNLLSIIYWNGRYGTLIFGNKIDIIIFEFNFYWFFGFATSLTTYNGYFIVYCITTVVNRG